MQLAAQLASFLVPGRALFFLIHLIGIACFSYIVAQRLVPLMRGERDFRFDQPWVRLGRVLKYWLGQWKQPRYRAAGTLHIFIFAGFLVLAIRAFSVLIVGVSPNFVPPGLSGRAGDVYGVITDYAATIVFLCMLIAVIRRLVFKPARYAVPAKFGKGHTADAIFLLSLIAILMLADSLIAATYAAAHAPNPPGESLAVLSLPWTLQMLLGSISVAALQTLNAGGYLI